MSFLMHVVAHVRHYLVFDTTLPYAFIHSSELEFKNLDFLSHIVAYIVSFDSRSWTRKSDIIRPRYELFIVCGGSYPSTLSFKQPYLTFSFTPLISNFVIWSFSSHVVSYIVSFYSRHWTRKSYIIQPRYELFNACGGSCPSLPCLWHNITVPFHPFLSQWVSEFRFFHPMF